MNVNTAAANRTAEWRLVLAVCADEMGASEPLRSLLAGPMEWDALTRLADEHGVTSLLYQNLMQVEESVPSEIMATLREKQERNIRRALLLAAELAQVADCAQTLGIELVAYKGVVLSEGYYGDMAIRSGGDVDLFVRARDVKRLKNALRELGYRPRMEIREEVESEYFASGYECSFDSPAGTNLLELQWALQPRFYAVDFDMEGLFARAVPVSVAGRAVKTPSAEDLLLVLSIHAAKHVWGRLIWLCDIARILQRDLDWNWIRAQALDLGVERILHVTLLLGNSLLGVEMPEGIGPAVREDGEALRLADRIEISIAAGVEYEEEKIAYFRLMMQLRERRRDRWRFLARLAFTPGPGEWEAVTLPRGLFPFYRVVRLGRLAGRLMSG